MDFSWSEEKNAVLKARHGFGFERVIIALAEGDLIAERRHPNVTRYPDQSQYIVRIDDYLWLVPFVRSADSVFLKTMYPSRKATKQFQEQDL
ncbi:toxin [Aurantimonas sp. 22II-16-19i]|uniref:toxin n=1 Tax=Aurantimonas sp. 22II-16-19i TaxID=1317114 RepID=UPI0009F800A9|nr:toxin [Aurantimonas sp. 22II-16-19i]ORE92778.1 hypothetical protein ATO4_16335 [Aurantimonas sp. 22II-16-19i]